MLLREIKTVPTYYIKGKCSSISQKQAVSMFILEVPHIEVDTIL